MTRSLVGRSGVLLPLAIGLIAVTVCTSRRAGAVDTPLAIDVMAIGFGPVNVGKSSTSEARLTNTGAGSFGPINIFGGAPPSAEFNASQNCQGTTLAPAGSCEVSYVFQPTAPGTSSDASNFTVSQTPNQSDGEDFSVRLTGVAVNPVTASPLSHDLGGVSVNDTSPTLTTTITNTSDELFGPLNIFGGDPPAAAFTASGNCQGATLSPAGSCNVNYAFAPTAPGTFSATSNFTISAGSQGAGEVFSVSLTGCGVAPGQACPSPTTTTTTTTLPVCDPDDCDGDVCTVGDACVGGTCSAGSVLTAGRLSGLLLETTSVAIAACSLDRGGSVKKVVKPLIRAAGLLGQAATAATATKRGKKLSLARRAVDRASQNLGNERGGLSGGCAARLDAALASARTGLSCLP